MGCIYATMTSDHKILYEFGPFRLDPSERLLLRDGKSVPLTGKTFDVLLVLVRRSGHLLDKSELLRLVWDGAFVEEGNIVVAVSLLRKALGDDGNEHRYIQTVAKRGYRFIGEVTEWKKEESESPKAPPDIHALPVALWWQPSAKSTLRIAVAAFLILILAFAVARVRKSGAAPKEIHSLAVLPFGSSTTIPAYPHLGLGMADGIITRLGTLGRIEVRPTSAVAKYAQTTLDPLAAGKDQKVDAVLTGNIEVSEDSIRVTAQLVRVSDGGLLWANTFEKSPAQVFVLEDEVGDGVARSMLSRNQPLTKTRQTTQNPRAYQLYMEGRYFWNKRTEEGLQRSIEYFRRASLEDQQYAMAYAGLADSYTLLASYGVEPANQAYPDAKAAALKALQLDDSLAEAHTSLGMVAFYYEWDWARAEEEFRRAIDLNPNYPMAHAWYGLCLAAMNRREEALKQVQLAQELDPLSLIINTEVGRVYYWARNYDQAIAAFQKAIDLDPHFARAHTRLGMAYAAERNYREATREFREAKRLTGQDPYLDGLIGYAEALSGHAEIARELSRKQTSRSSGKEYIPPYSQALICIGLGERAQALDWFSKSYQDRSTYMVYAKVDPLLDPLRSDPKFAQVLARMGLLTSEHPTTSRVSGVMAN
jgi:DNA-binding winged helix-turn-helix (wHTH) protein/TolB-like protein/tetratricopeptide (TPR) repeat protein